MLLTIDPGLRGCGIALFGGPGILVHASYPNIISTYIVGGREANCAALCDAVLEAVRSHPVTILAIETPVIYPGKGKIDPNDIVNLSLLAGVLAGAVYARFNCPVRFLKPREWKGTLNADIMTARIRDRLIPEELVNVQHKSKTLDHNIYDAIGIGLFLAKRLVAKKVINYE